MTSGGAALKCRSMADDPADLAENLRLTFDLCATGETLLRAAASFHDAGALRVSAAITHVASAEGLRALCANRYLSQVVVTDSALTPEAEIRDSARGRLYVKPCASLFGPSLAQIVSR